MTPLGVAGRSLPPAAAGWGLVGAGGWMGWRRDRWAPLCRCATTPFLTKRGRPLMPWRNDLGRAERAPLGHAHGRRRGLGGGCRDAGLHSDLYGVDGMDGGLGQRSGHCARMPVHVTWKREEGREGGPRGGWEGESPARSIHFAALSLDDGTSTHSCRQGHRHRGTTAGHPPPLAMR